MEVLLMTYSNMKPMDPAAHTHIAEWVRRGGVLVYSGRDNDPFQSVLEWWNTGGNDYKTPADHLFELMGIEAGAPEGEYRHGKGTVFVLRADPKEFVLTEGGDGRFVEVVKEMYEKRAGAGKLIFKNSFYLERGPYTLAAVVDEGVSDEPYTVKGKLIDLFDPELPVLAEKTVRPGEQAYLFDVARVSDKKRPQVLAAASREYDEVVAGRSYSFVAKSPVETTNVSRVLLPRKPKSVLVDGRQSVSTTDWDETTKTCLLKFENSPEGVSVRIEW
jgi:hypothetical protein